jgi:hypothetical protein
VEPVGRRSLSLCRRGAEAGSGSETQVPEPMWNRGAELSHLPADSSGGDDRIRTGDPLLAKQDYGSSITRENVHKPRSED